MKILSSKHYSKSCRTLRPSDAGVCASLHRASFSSPWAVGEFERLLTSPSVVADCIGDAADVSAFILSRCVAPEAEILTISVAPSMRGHGLSTTLLGHHLSRLAQTGISEVFLEVAESNVPALKLYRSHGFEKVGERAGYYSLPGGGRSTAMVMRCAL